MLIRNKTLEAREIAATGQIVEGGDTVEVEDDDLAKSLVEQVDVWEPAEGGAKNVDQVLADVDGDPTRARQALAVENDSGKPRKTLVSRLEEIIATDEESS